MSEAELIERMEYEVLGVDIKPQDVKTGFGIASELTGKGLDAWAQGKARKEAVAAAEEAKKETDPNGPLHQKAAQLAMAAGMPLLPGQQPPPAPSDPSFLDKMKRNPLPYVAGGLGIAAALSIVVILLRRR
jgi:hypothetical protein